MVGNGHAAATIRGCRGGCAGPRERPGTAHGDAKMRRPVASMTQKCVGVSNHAEADGRYCRCSRSCLRRRPRRAVPQPEPAARANPAAPPPGDAGDGFPRSHGPGEHEVKTPWLTPGYHRAPGTGIGAGRRRAPRRDMPNGPETRRNPGESTARRHVPPRRAFHLAEAARARALLEPPKDCFSRGNLPVPDSRFLRNEANHALTRPGAREMPIEPKSFRNPGDWEDAADETNRVARRRRAPAPRGRRLPPEAP